MTGLDRQKRAFDDPQPAITVGIIEDHALVRAGLPGLPQMMGTRHPGK